MYIKDESVEIDSLKQILGYSIRDIEKTIERLIKAELLIERDQSFKLKSLESVFFVKKIISIEAKIKNWKKAFEQAWLNEFFASESYVLLPHNTINAHVIEYSQKLGVGVIAHEAKKSVIIKESKSKRIPSSYSSWVFNENIGRRLYYENYHQEQV